MNSSKAHYCIHFIWSNCLALLLSIHSCVHCCWLWLMYVMVSLKKRQKIASKLWRSSSACMQSSLNICFNLPSEAEYTKSILPKSTMSQHSLLAKYIHIHQNFETWSFSLEQRKIRSSFSVLLNICCLSCRSWILWKRPNFRQHLQSGVPLL